MTLAWVRLVIALQSLLSCNSSIQLDLSFNLECNGLCFVQIGAVEVEISFFICNQPLMKILSWKVTKSGVVNSKNSSKIDISTVTSPI